MKKKTKYRLVAAGLGVLCGTLFACSTQTTDNSKEEITVEKIWETPQPEFTVEPIEIVSESTDKIEIIEENIEPEIILSPLEIEEEKFDDEVVTFKNVYFASDANLYDTDNNFVNTVEIYNRALELFHTNEWSLIYIDEEYMYTENSNIKDLGNDFVEIDIGDQNVKLIKDNELLVDTPTVTGNLRTKHPTHIGLYEIWSMEHDRYLIGPGYKSWVYYFMPFDGGIGLHDALWRDEFGGEIYKTDGSHGCVNLPLEAAKDIYENVNVGYKVLVHN